VRRSKRPGRVARPLQATGTMRFYALLLAFVLALAAPPAGAYTARIKDIVDIEGVRKNQLVGYGLVVGLNGTGDSLGNAPFTEQSLIAMLERLGVNIRGQNLNTGNVAAVMVTAALPPFAGQGTTIDVNVSALGDASSLQGGTLLVTPLLAADGQAYAVAQGAVNIAGFTAGGAAEEVTQNTPTAGRVPGGGTVEKEIAFTLADLPQVRLSLKNPDFTTARRIADAVNAYAGRDLAVAENGTSVRLSAAPDQSIVETITDIEQLPVRPDQVARVVISERSGVIVMGANVRISEVAIAQGNLTIKVTETPEASQPEVYASDSFVQSGAETVVLERTDVEVNQGPDTKLAVLDGGVTLQDLVTGLNRLGMQPRDIITILQAIKAAGALQAEIEVL
jgi:flagellar P-ring protein precursor FlgI